MANLSTFTAVPFIAERSEATPGLWNNIFSVISQNLDQLNSQAEGISTTGVSTNTLAAASGNTVIVNAILSTNTLAPQSGSTVSLIPTAAFVANSIQSGNGWFDVRAFGAVGDGVTDDTAAFRSAISAANAVGGVVYYGGGASVTYQLSSTLTFPNNTNASLVGTPGTVLQAKSAYGNMISIDGTGGGSRNGVFRDITLDGNSFAKNGLNVGLCELRLFENITVKNCTAVGAIVSTTQNCTFVSCNFTGNGTTGALDTQLLLDLGASNNNFIRCQVSSTNNAVSGGSWDCIIRQSAGAATAQPTDNTFVGCLFEGMAQTSQGAIYHKAGRNNVFISCDISAPFAASGATAPVAFWTDGSDTVGGALNQYPRFLECRFAGSTASSIGAKVQKCSPAIFQQSLFEGFNIGFLVDDLSYCDLGEPVTGQMTTFLQGSGVKALSQLATAGRILSFTSIPTGAPVANLAQANPTLYDTTDNAIFMYNGAWRRTDMTSGEQRPAYGATVTIDCSGGMTHQINVTNGTPFTIANPTNTLDSKRLYLDIWNNSGGVMGAITMGSKWRPNGAIIGPANGLHRIYEFMTDAYTGNLREMSRSPSDTSD